MFRSGSELSGVNTPDTTISDKVNPPRPIQAANVNAVNSWSPDQNENLLIPKKKTQSNSPKKAKINKQKKNLQNEKIAKKSKNEKKEKSDPTFKGSLFVTGIY